MTNLNLSLQLSNKQILTNVGDNQVKHMIKNELYKKILTFLGLLRRLFIQRMNEV